MLAGPDGRGGLLSNPFDTEFVAPTIELDVTEAVKGLRLLTADQLETIVTSIRLGRIAGHEVLWRYGPVWDDWPQEEREAWEIFSQYTGVVYHNYRYKYGRTKGNNKDGSASRVDATSVLKPEEQSRVSDLSKKLSAFYAATPN